MNKLVTEICRILDFPEKNADIALNEAFKKGKLSGTWMFVNGELGYVDGHNNPEENLLYVAYNWVEVESLDVFLPEAGLYTSGNAVALVTKKAFKQWQKSFNSSFYNFWFLTGDMHLDYMDLAKQKPKRIMQVGDKVYVWSKHVGTIKGNDVSCNNPLFYQELIDHSERSNLGWNVQL